VFVNGFAYFVDWFNSFDATIVSVSFVIFFIEGIESRGLAALRLLRLARLVIVLRKVSSSKRKSKGEFNTALEEVIFILNQVKLIKKLPLKVKKELVWAIDLIESNKLYEVSMAVSSDKGSGPNA